MSKFDDKYAERDVSEGKWIFWFPPPHIETENLKNPFTFANGD